MQLNISKSYLRDLRGINHTVQLQANDTLEKLKQAHAFSEIQHLEPIIGHPGYYRIRIGQYRIGLRWDGEKFFAERIGPRGNIYKVYPPK